MVTICWSAVGLIHDSFLNPSKTTTSEKYAQQIDEMYWKLQHLQPSLVNRNGPILLHTNTWPHITQPMGQKLNKLGYKVLPHPPYSPDLLPTNYHFFKHLITLYRQHIKKQRRYFAKKGPSDQSNGFSSSHVWMWELDYKESWASKNLCFWTVVLEKTLESPLDIKEIQPVHPKGNQPWILFGRTDAEAETPIFWPPDVKNWLIWKDPDTGKDWRQKEKGTAVDEMVGWHHRHDGHEFE